MDSGTAKPSSGLIKQFPLSLVLWRFRLNNVKIRCRTNKRGKRHRLGDYACITYPLACLVFRRLLPARRSRCHGGPCPFHQFSRSPAASSFLVHWMLGLHGSFIFHHELFILLQMCYTQATCEKKPPKAIKVCRRLQNPCAWVQNPSRLTKLTLYFLFQLPFYFLFFESANRCQRT